MVAENDGNLAVVEGMQEDHAFELLAGMTSGGTVVRYFPGLHGDVDQFLGHQEIFIAGASRRIPRFSLALIAWLQGMVQGVVVQIRAIPFPDRHLSACGR